MWVRTKIDSKLSKLYSEKKETTNGYVTNGGHNKRTISSC